MRCFLARFDVAPDVTARKLQSLHCLRIKTVFFKPLERQAVCVLESNYIRELSPDRVVHLINALGDY